MKIMVTGANGFFGSRVAAALAADSSRETVLFARPSGQENLPAGPNVRVASGDLTDPVSVKKALAGCDGLVHTAAHVAAWARRPEVFERVNVEATLNLLREAGEAGVGRIIYVSSFLALRHSTDGRPVDEETPCERSDHYNDYERTKYEANLQAIALARAGLPVVILYPTVMFGPGPLTSGNLIARMMVDFMKRKLPAKLGDGTPRWDFVFVEDVVQGALLALEKAVPPDRFILGGEDVSLAQFFATLEEVTGVKAPRFSVPFPLARLAGAVEELMAVLFARPPQTTRAVVDIFRKDWVFDSSKACSRLGYAPRSFAEGVRQTVDWIRSRGLAS